jgi:hypothetical protein
MSDFHSDIELGEVYVDAQTGYEGTVTAVYFFQHACERVLLEAYDSKTKKVIETVFDAPRLTHKASGKKATTEKTGGPAREVSVRPMGGAR